jgi:hypothetical protein
MLCVVLTINLLRVAAQVVTCPELAQVFAHSQIVPKELGMLGASAKVADHVLFVEAGNTARGILDGSWDGLQVADRNAFRHRHHGAYDHVVLVLGLHLRVF